VPLPGLIHKCYRDSFSASTVVVSQLTLHRMRHTWTEKVNAFITLTDFARERFIEGGLPANRLHVKPHFIDPDPGVGNHSGDYALYVGRLGKEKGTGTLMKAWEIVGERVPLIVVGEGPDQPLVEAAAKKNPKIQFLGKVERSKAIELMKSARYNLMPSDCWEMFGMSMLEAKAVGLPTIASNHGSFPSLIEDGKTGLLFEPMNADDLAAKVMGAVEHPTEWEAMRDLCRADYLANYTAETNYRQLIDIYRSAIDSNTA
jgi:glycosyltransferase involved in cell wall biosynthesis